MTKNDEEYRFASADPRPRLPAFAMPAGACDAHAHVFGPRSRYPYSAQREYTPPDQTLDQYLHMLDSTGLAWGVLSQPSVYGDDNSCLVDALKGAGGRLRGIVVADVTRMADSEIESMTSAGVRGVRINLALPGGLGIDMLEAACARLAGTGWHLEIVLDSVERLHELAPRLRRATLEIVVEQMGSMRAGQDIDGPGFRALIALLRDGRAWTKLSHSYKISRAGLPYADTVPYARALVDAAPDRLVWGSDWPHPRTPGLMPNDGALLDLLLEWTGDLSIAQRILSANAARLYRFPPSSPTWITS